MENTTGVRGIERKTLYNRCVRALRDGGSRNLYLFEGIGRNHPKFSNFCFLSGNRVLGVLHTKNGICLHLFIDEAAQSRETAYMERYISTRFPCFTTLFCDRTAFTLFSRHLGNRPDSVRSFISMGVKRRDFVPGTLHRTVVPPVSHAGLFVPLQVSYEVEEVGVRESEIDRETVRRAIKARISRREITAVYKDGRPVAMAGVNARFQEICQVGSIYVIPGMRNRGYGRSVVSSHVDRLLEHYERVVLFVDVQNAAARHVYERIGFTGSGFLVQASFTPRFRVPRASSACPPPP